MGSPIQPPSLGTRWARPITSGHDRVRPSRDRDSICPAYRPRNRTRVPTIKSVDTSVVTAIAICPPVISIAHSRSGSEPESCRLDTWRMTPARATSRPACFGAASPEKSTVSPTVEAHGSVGQRRISLMMGWRAGSAASANGPPAIRADNATPTGSGGQMETPAGGTSTRT